MKTKHLAPGKARAPRSRKFRWGLLAFGILVIASGLYLIMSAYSVTPSSEVPTITGSQTNLLDQEIVPTRPIRSVVPLDTSHMDAASQGILNYIRVRDAIPDYIILSYFRSKDAGAY